MSNDDPYTGEESASSTRAETEGRSYDSAHQNLVEVWDDTTSVWGLVFALVVSTGLTLGGFLLAPGEDPQPLVVGLVGAFVGFIIISFVLKPSRRLEIEDEDKEG